MPPKPAGAAKTFIDTLTTSDGKHFIFVEPSMDATGGRTFVFAVPDRARAETAGDLIRILPIVLLVLILVGAPVAYLLSRSLTGPMRRLAQAAADLPGGSGPHAPLPLEGPTEVRTLTERFNAMAYELDATRSQESQMLANLRHDLRTPLTSIAGFAEAIADGTASGDRATSAARTIAEEAQRLERLVGELEVVDRLRQGPSALRPEGLEARELLRHEAGRFAARASGQGVAIEIVPESPGDQGTPGSEFRRPRRHCRRSRVHGGSPRGGTDPAEPGRQRASVLPTGGHVWLAAAPLHLEGRPKGISLSVTDDGPGFPPGTQSRVFERFFRADPSRAGSGSGLGLAIVRELARAHGGEAWAENVAPRGARVTVFLPVTPPSPGILPG